MRTVSIISIERLSIISMHAVSNISIERLSNLGMHTVSYDLVVTSASSCSSSQRHTHTHTHTQVIGHGHRYSVPKWLLFLINVGTGFHCLRSSSFFFSLSGVIGHRHRYSIPKWLLFLINVGIGFHCLRSFSFLFSLTGVIGQRHKQTHTQTHKHAGSDFVEPPDYTAAVLFRRSFDIGAFIGLARTVFTHTHTHTRRERFCGTTRLYCGCSFSEIN